MMNNFVTQPKGFLQVKLIFEEITNLQKIIFPGCIVDIVTLIEHCFL